MASKTIFDENEAERAKDLCSNLGSDVTLRTALSRAHLRRITLADCL